MIICILARVWSKVVDTLAIMEDSRLVCVMFVQVLCVYVLNVPSRQIHNVFTSTLKMNFLRESTMPDCTGAGGRG